MGCGLGSSAPLRDVWDTSVALTALTFGVPAALIAADSRGRGPRPPESARWPRKVAMQLTVLVSDCDYLELADLLGMHRDTPRKHCLELRERFAADPAFEALIDGLVMICQVRVGLGWAHLLTSDGEEGGDADPS